MWLLLCHTQNLKVMKVQQCPQVFNLPFKMNLYLLDQVIKRQEKWKKKKLGKLSLLGYLFSEIYVS